ncbi:glycoside hydrolase [Niallia circulans]|uniref:glycosylhydrolase-like jelly roll fold domain-containing protein n=1 Tax=Niallia circulans TaxID=1397 RepID=UPI00201D3786|nr:glycosylhydrolase-like jelly roll fold domain-containing protein [Niallia circulans]UQZ73442.1 glycoside hydrolase [Niallia circulans]
MKRVKEVLDNKNDNYILPFFWLHGEDNDILRDYVKKIYESGIKAFIVESRPHPDFLGESWWENMDTLMEEAKKLGMKVWLLDDSHFPTGYANGRVKNDYPQYIKKYLKIHQLDFVGPLEDATILVNRGNTKQLFSKEKEYIPDKLLKIIAAKRTGNSSFDSTSFIDITNFEINGILNWSIPEGQWRIFVLMETIDGGEPQTEGYLNPLESQATRILIDEVYQPHYKRYKSEFGKTFAGFFSDEPRFGNMHGAEGSIGRKEMVYPWREGMLEEFFLDDYVFLPLLEPIESDGKEKEVRLKYMDIVSKEYSNNFTGVLAEWCQKRNVEYIGHLIEDNNSHARLGYGAGHFFRAIKPQDMSGIDVVLNQIMPGMDKNINKSITKMGWDGEFFHYGLAKMGASLGQLDRKKGGRTICEVFGAYGWAEGLSLMKYIVDHMLVRGVNHFIPHAFSPKTFPDPDCPPHFYANGHDPEFRYMYILNNYINRISHLFNGGKHIAKVGILYHAEAEWLGNYMLFQEPARVLMQHQIDFDIIPIDYVMESKITNNEFLINNNEFHTLIIPYAESLPLSFMEKVEAMSKNGISIYFVNNYPLYSEKNKRLDESFFSGTNKVNLESLGEELKIKGTELIVSEYQPYLRYYHYEHIDGNLYMFFNEDPYQEINTVAELNSEKVLLKYDGFNNELLSYDQFNKEGKKQIPIQLQPNESLILVDNNKFEGMITKNVNQLEGKETILQLKWKVEFCTALEYPTFGNLQELNNLININKLPGLECFSGNFKYTSTFNSIDLTGDRFILDLGIVNEIAEVKLNGELVGIKICTPYSFEITDYLQKGINHLEIVVVDNLGKQEQDFFSQFIPMKPSGLLGPVKVIEYKGNYS